MNLIDCYVTKILSKPYFEYDRWWVNVEFTSYGVLGKKEIMFKTREEAEGISIGYKFLS